MSEAVIIIILSGYAATGAAIVAVWKRGNKIQDKYEDQLLKQAEEHQNTVDALYMVVKKMQEGGRRENPSANPED